MSAHGVQEQAVDHEHDRRNEERFTLILRAGLLEQSGRQSLCIVRNISSTGLQLRFYSEPTVDAAALLRIADEPPIEGQLVWVRHDIAGMRFAHELDTAALLRVRQKLSPIRRRSMPRVNVDALATLRSGGKTQRAGLCDISSLGARVRTTSPLRIGDRAVIDVAGLPPLNAFVRWSGNEEAGLAFEAAIPMQLIARWVEGRELLAN